MGSPDAPLPKDDPQAQNTEESDYYLVELGEAEEVQLKTLEWEDYERQLVGLWSIVTTLRNAKDKKEELHKQLETILKVRSQNLARENELEMMKHNLEIQKRRLGCSFQLVDNMSEEVQVRHEKLRPMIHDIMVAAKSLNAARGRLMEANKLLLGESGHGRLTQLQRMLRSRQQLMTMQAANLYPVGRCTSQKALPEENGPELSPGSSIDTSVETLTIAGLQLIAPPVKKLGFFNDKKLIQSSAAAFGYVAHDLDQLLSYLGTQSVGPRHTLPNLKRLLKAIQSDEFVLTNTTPRTVRA
eukprot:TRINITY_DN17393_c0_g1_i1.p1 TRINITY_DN17393_c0_g1~~TRINITY_DN17393_c0_g1_i1.p1  ORF type:complete len:299 (-),score=68.64 TRINITY_DN17393_c0_g1_i1:581-1477(-)